jgi:hypothetical protein
MRFNERFVTAWGDSKSFACGLYTICYEPFAWVISNFRISSYKNW